MKIVFLDSGTLPSHHPISRPSSTHQWHEYQQTRPEDVVDRCKNAHILVTNKVPITLSILERCPKLKHVAVAATGYNIVDVDACRQFGVSVSNIPSYAQTTVPEHVLMCALALRRQVQQYQQKVVDGAWQQSPHFCVFDRPIHQIKGCTVGILGYGCLGSATADLMRKLGAKVIVHSRRQVEGVNNVSLDDLLATSDVLSVHCSLTDSSKSLIGKNELARMSSDAILINTARGGIVDETALAHAIQSKLIAGAAIDVLANEPPSDESPLLELANQTNVIITPHIAWASESALARLVSILGSNIEAFVNGNPQNLVSDF